MNILVSSIIDQALVATLEARFPEHTFLHMRDNDTPPDGIEQVEAFLRCAIKKPQQERLIELAPRMRWLHTCSAGFDYVPLEAIRARGMTLTRSAQTNNVPIAEYVLAHILGFSKRLPELAAAQTTHTWQRRNDLEELGDKTVGIVGVGSIGAALATRCRALGMGVIATRRSAAPHPDFDEILPSSALPDLLERSDFVVVACPLTDETRGLFDAAEFAAMKPTARLINVARGPIVVTSALIEALEQGRIAGAALDVYDEEPLPEDSPLWSAPNLVLTPHISFVSPHNLGRAVDEFAANLERFLRGEPLLNTMRNEALGY